MARKIPPAKPLGEPAPPDRPSYYVQTMTLAKLRAHCGRASDVEFIDALKKHRVQFGRELKGKKIYWIDVAAPGFFGQVVPDGAEPSAYHEDYYGYVLVDPNIAFDAVQGVEELRVNTFVRIWELPEALPSPDVEDDLDELVPPSPPQPLGGIRRDGSGPRFRIEPDPPLHQPLCEWGIKLTKANILVHREDAEVVFSDLRGGLKLGEVEAWEADAAFRRVHDSEPDNGAPIKTLKAMLATDLRIIGALSSLLANRPAYQKSKGRKVNVSAIRNAALKRLANLPASESVGEHTLRTRITAGLIATGLATVDQLACDEEGKMAESGDNSPGS